eukprot:526067-Rhodomonas_salina.1
MNRQAQVVRAECSAVAAELLAVMEASSMPAFETTIDGKVTFWSPKMASITGADAGRRRSRSMSMSMMRCLWQRRRSRMGCVPGWGSWRVL